MTCCSHPERAMPANAGPSTPRRNALAGPPERHQGAGGTSRRNESSGVSRTLSDAPESHGPGLKPDPTSRFQLTGPRCPRTGGPIILCQCCTDHHYGKAGQWDTMYKLAYQDPTRTAADQLKELYYTRHPPIGSKSSGYAANNTMTRIYDNNMDFLKNRGFTNIVRDHYTTVYKKDFVPYEADDGTADFPEHMTYGFQSNGAFLQTPRPERIG